jgi:NAD-dependent dihydropyrimidine dehydrogenase PreA subunit
MGRVSEFLWETFHTFFRNFNFPCKLELITIGKPTPHSPVFLSGNYSLVVHRLQKVLRGTDCYLLVANSRGSNVWCAAGMNEYTEHDVVDAIDVANLAKLVHHRQIIAPPYAAPGLDLKYIKEKTGFHLKWGPTHLDDIPQYIKNGYKRSNDMVQVQFGFRDRLEQALANINNYCMTIAIGLLIFPKYILGAMGLIVVSHLFWFCGWEWLPEERYWRRSAFVAAIMAAAVAGLGIWRSWSVGQFFLWEVTSLLVVVVMGIDGCGSSAVYKTTAWHWLTEGNYDSLFDPVIDPQRCTNCMQCVLVCPKNVFAAKRTGEYKVVSVHPENCIDCLACVKQCDDDAFFNRSRQYKGDVKSIANLDQIMTRDWSHLTAEDRWLNHPTVLRNGLPVVDIANNVVAKDKEPEPNHASIAVP